MLNFLTSCWLASMSGKHRAADLVIQAIATNKLHVMASSQVIDSLSKLGTIDTHSGMHEQACDSFYFVDDSASLNNPVWPVVLNSIRGATSIFTNPGGSGGSDWKSHNNYYSASITQNKTSLTVELIVNNQQMYNVWLGKKGQHLLLVICQDYQSCWLFG